MQHETSNGSGPGSHHDVSLTPEQQYPQVRPHVARMLVELDQRIEEGEARARREDDEWNRPRGIMGRLFGLRTHVID